MPKHDTSLTLKQLLNVIDRYLDDHGYFFILLPYHRTEYFEKEAAGLKFYLKEKMLIKQTPAHSFFRSILCFSRKEMTESVSELTIKDNNGTYTNGFADLLKDYIYSCNYS